MTDLAFIETLGLIVVAASALILVGGLAKVPPIASAMLAGFLLGPVLGLVGPSRPEADLASIDLVAEIGIVLLLFLVGLELSPKELRAVGPVAVAGALVQSLVMGGLVLALAVPLGFSWPAAVVVAIALGFSSTVVVIKQLEAAGDLERTFGRIAVGILLVQDLLVILVLTVLAGLGIAESMSPGVVAGAVGRAFLFMGVLLAATLLTGRFVLPRLFGAIAASPSATLVTALAWCMVVVEAAALLELSIEVGAFLAGLALGRLPRRHDLRRRVRPLMGFFIAVFFASLGSRIDLGVLADRWPAALALTALVLVVKPPVFHFVVRRMGYDRRTSFDAAITLMQISEFSLILGAAALATPGLLAEGDAAAISLLGVVALASILVSVVAMNLREGLFRRAVRTALLGRPSAAPEPASTEALDAHWPPLAGHVVVAGMNPLGLRVARALEARGEQVVVVDTDPGKLAGVGTTAVVGDIDHPETLEQAGLARARLAICALRIESANRLFAHRCSVIGVPFVLHAFDRSVREGLAGLGARALLDPKRAADRQVDEVLRERGLLPDPAVADAAGDHGTDRGADADGESAAC